MKIYETYLNISDAFGSRPLTKVRDFEFLTESLVCDAIKDPNF